LGIFSLLVTLVLSACGDATSTTAPATTAPAAATTAAATTAAATTAAATTAAATTAAATTAAATTAAATTAATTTAAITPNTSVSGNVRIAIAPSSPAEDAIVDQQLANFAKAYPNVKATKEVIASDYTTKIQTELAGGSPPDIFYVDSLIAPDLIVDKQLEPLNSYADKNKVNISDFYPNLVKAFTGSDGKVYGLPKDHNTLAMIYNKDMFQKAGITTPPKTWDELTAAAQKLKASLPADSAAIALEPDIARMLAFVYQGGGSMLSADGKSSTVTDPGFKKGMDFYVGLRTQGFAKKSSELGADWPGDALVKGKAAIAFEGGWFIPFATAANAMDKFSLAELPKGEQQGNLDFTVAYVMAAKSANKDAAFALLSFLTSDSQQKLLSDAGLALPSRTALTDGFLAKYPERKALLDGVPYSKPWQFGVGFGGFDTKVNPVLQAVFSGSKTIDQGITDIDKLVKTQLSNQ
jgi:multiple sugar transport system substrate-binding protein